jgi:hypothetical protein
MDVFFGPGLICRRIPLRRIREIRVVRTPWYYGWGIRLTPAGWLWNVSGLDGVEVQCDDGHRFRVGSDEPNRLAEALRREMRAGEALAVEKKRSSTEHYLRGGARLKIRRADHCDVFRSIGNVSPPE